MCGPWAVNSNEAGDIELSDIKWKQFSCFELFIIRTVCNTCGRTNDVEIYGIDRRFDMLGCLYDAFLDFQSEGEQNCSENSKAFCDYQCTASCAVYFALMAFATEPFVPALDIQGRKAFFVRWQEAWGLVSCSEELLQ